MVVGKPSQECVKFLIGKTGWQALSVSAKAEAVAFVREAALQIWKSDRAKRANMLAKLPIGPRAKCQEVLDSLAYEMEERAAIRQYDGGASKSEAERITRADYGVI
jgi:hypothetical protein